MFRGNPLRKTQSLNAMPGSFSLSGGQQSEGQSMDSLFEGPSTAEPMDLDALFADLLKDGSDIMAQLMTPITPIAPELPSPGSQLSVGLNGCA
jgi:hypothetical protein